MQVCLLAKKLKLSNKKSLKEKLNQNTLFTFK